MRRLSLLAALLVLCSCRFIFSTGPVYHGAVPFRETQSKNYFLTATDSVESTWFCRNEWHNLHPESNIGRLLNERKTNFIILLKDGRMKSFSFMSDEENQQLEEKLKKNPEAVSELDNNTSFEVSGRWAKSGSELLLSYDGSPVQSIGEISGTELTGRSKWDRMESTWSGKEITSFKFKL